jgi:hypothetical protein
MALLVKKYVTVVTNSALTPTPPDPPRVGYGIGEKGL